MLISWVVDQNLTCILLRFTSMYNQLSVEKAMAINAAATIAVMVAIDKVTAEQGIFQPSRNSVKR